MAAVKTALKTIFAAKAVFKIFKNLIIIIMTNVLVNNYVLNRFLGVCPFLGVTKKTAQAAGMGYAVTFVMIVATAATWPIQKFLLMPNELGYMQTVVFILIIASLVQLVEIIFKKYFPALQSSLGIYLPLITTNCAVLGITIDNINNEFTFIESIASAFGAGLGFLLAMLLFSGVRSRIANENIPESFKGLPITLIAASIVSLSFFGFGGIIENLFA